jgi:hypothetical protein
LVLQYQATIRPPRAMQYAPTGLTASPAEIWVGIGHYRKLTDLIGFTASKTGKLNVEATRQINGRNLWVEQVNEEICRK